ncbi:toxin glutamine deamidase domain-containing protein [Streptomyces sp. 1331.2]|uniref:toxin glutamine deamidase domain-containing protein n=1 Tax=Streptomyces sp. 1331.2 TaxID=1938835 RepID=UPI000BCAAB3B|nr:toxin glutamine deamidase domain-containing protein [Streptomyces sp. 1331.2]SOB83449.1 Papain fold toxin 1, glutamine deamidase [Streptomyces sp. 1331.2]
MSRKLPEELVPVLARTGHQWPQADEEGLRKAAGVWREFGTEADRLTRRCGESVHRVTADNSGHAVEAFGAYWQAFSGGGKGHLDDTHTAVGLVAGAFDTAARAVDTCKAEIVATLQQLAADLRQAEEQAAKAKEAAGKVADRVAAEDGGSGSGSGSGSGAGSGAGAGSGSGAGSGPSGVVGGLEKAVGGLAAEVKNAATAQVAEGVAAVAVEAAALKIGGLLAELGRSMKDALATALKEPAAVALLRLGTAPGTGITTASYRTGAFDPTAAGLPAALREPGVLGADGAGLVLLTGKDGKPLVGVPGLTVKLDEHGQPVLGQDGRPVILRADGSQVADASGLLVVPGPDGKPVVGVADLAVRLDEHGQPVLTGSDGRDLRGLPLAGLPAGDGPAGGRAAGAEGAPGKQDPTGPGGLTVASAVVADPGSVVGGVAGGADTVGAVPSGSSYATGGWQGQHRAAAGGDWTPPSRDDGASARSVAAPVRQGGGSAGWSDGDYPLQAPAAPAPAPAHGGGGGGGGTPVTLRTDSVTAPAPAAPSVSSGPAAGSWSNGSWSNGSSYGPGPDVLVVRPVGTPVYGGGYPAVGTVGTVGAVGPGPLAVGGVGGVVGGGAAHGAAPFGSGVGAGAPGGTVGGGTVGGGVVGGGSQPGVEPRPGTAVPRTPAAAAPQPVTGPPSAQAVPPAPAAPPIVGTTPVIGRPEPHPGDARRRDTAPTVADPTLAWGAVPVATAHAMALQLALRARRGGHPDDPGARLRSITDSRPYGLPGGLAPVDPQHQAELERRAPRDEDGLPARYPDPAVGGWTEAVNDGGHREPGRANNSLEIALSAVECYAGRPTCAAPRIPTEGDAGERGGRDRAERELGAPFRDLGDGGQAFDRLADDLRRAGHGAQAVLLTRDSFGRPHAWNAVNHQDTVTYLDHQLARRSPTPLHPATHGLWAIALTPEGHPLDLAPTA